MSIEVRNVFKYYGEQAAVKGISFSVQSGEIVGFLGPNGAGKSTTMKMITGYIPATSGEILVSGMRVGTDQLDPKKKIEGLREEAKIKIIEQAKLQIEAEKKGYPIFTINEDNLYLKKGFNLLPQPTD